MVSTRGIRTGNIPAKVVSVGCIYVIGLSIKRELLPPAITLNLHFFASYYFFQLFLEIRDYPSTITLTQKSKFDCRSEGIR